MNIQSKKLTNREYFNVAIPFMLSTLTQPILGIVDTAVVGQLSNPIYIGGVSIGVVVFNTIYWVFGFLRVSTTSYSAQSIGGNNIDKLKSFVHPLIIAIIVGSIIILLKGTIWITYMKIISPKFEIVEQAQIYYSILIWGAPIVMSNYVILGWLMGQSKVKASVIMQITGNIINIFLDILFVMVFGMKINGVAMATLLSQIATFLLGIIFMTRYSGFKLEELKNKELFDKSEVLNKVFTNTDYIIRTVCLLIVNNMFAASSAHQGTVILAANTIILQLESLISYLFEGLASSTSVFVGKAIGEQNVENYGIAVNITFRGSIILSLILTIIYIFFREDIIYLFTNTEEVILCIKEYDFWIAIYPTIACLGLTFYGVFSGAMETKAIRNSTFSSMILFMIIHEILVPRGGNHGLWLSFLIYYLGRSIFLMIYLKGLNNKVNNIKSIYN